MPYLLTKFDTVLLPRSMPEDDLSTGQVDSTIIGSVGAVYDYAGSARRWPKRHEFQHKGLYVGIDPDTGTVVERATVDDDQRVTVDGDVRIIISDAFINLQSQTDDLKAKIGMRGQLWRQRISDGVLSWKQCRLLQVSHVEDVDKAGQVSEVESTFETMMSGWHAQSTSSASVVATAGVATALTITNSNGLLPVFDGVLTVVRGTGTITSVRIQGVGIDLTWNGSLGSGTNLTIDSGLNTVVTNPGGVDAYSGLTYNAGHVSQYFLPLAVGLNSWTVTLTGGNGTVAFTYYAQWP